MILEESDFLIDDKVFIIFFEGWMILWIFPWKLRELSDESEDGIYEKLECVKNNLCIDSVDEMNIFVRDLITQCRVKSPDE